MSGPSLVGATVHAAMIGVKTKKKKAKKDKKSKSSGDGERKTAAELRVIRDTEMDFKHLPAQLIQLYLPDPVSNAIETWCTCTLLSSLLRPLPLLMHLTCTLSMTISPCVCARSSQSCYLTIVARVTCETGYWKGIPFMFHINFPCDKPNDYPMVPPKYVPTMPTQKYPRNPPPLACYRCCFFCPLLTRHL